jgi:hypothetical protein
MAANPTTRRATQHRNAGRLVTLARAVRWSRVPALTAMAGLSLTVLLVLLVFFGSLLPSSAGPMLVATPAAAEPDDGSGSVATTLTPRLTIDGASPSQRERLEVALDRFRRAGLPLPDLEVVVADSTAACRGHHGRFDPGVEPWRITICSDLDFVYEHELAHAWERAAATDEQRAAFLRLRGLPVWHDPAVPWQQRGVEDAAFIVQQALSGQPLRTLGPASHEGGGASFTEEQRSRLAAYELLTGSPDPRLASTSRTDRDRPAGAPPFREAILQAHRALPAPP